MTPNPFLIVLRSLALGLTLAGEYLLACNLISYYQLNLSFFPGAKYVVAAMIALSLPFFLEFLFSGTISLRKRAGVLNWLLLLLVTGLIVSLALFRHLGDSLTASLAGAELSSTGAAAALQVSSGLMNSPFASLSYALLSLLVPIGSARLLTRLHHDVEDFRSALRSRRLLAARLEQAKLSARIGSLETEAGYLNQALEALEQRKLQAFSRRQLILWARQQGNGQLAPEPGNLPGLHPETTLPGTPTTVSDLTRTSGLALNSFLSVLLLAIAATLTGCSETPRAPAPPSNVLYLYDRSASVTASGEAEARLTARWLAADALPGTTVRFAYIYQNTAQALPVIEAFRVPPAPAEGHNAFLNQAVAADYSTRIARDRDSISRQLTRALQKPFRSPYTDLFGTLALARQLKAGRIRLWSDMLHDPGNGKRFSFRFTGAKDAAAQGVADARDYLQSLDDPQPLARTHVSVVVPLALPDALRGSTPAPTYLNDYWQAFFRTAGAPSVEWENQSLHP
jgi:hypothetical protein